MPGDDSGFRSRSHRLFLEDFRAHSRYIGEKQRLFSCATESGSESESETKQNFDSLLLLNPLGGRRSTENVFNPHRFQLRSGRM